MTRNICRGIPYAANTCHRLSISVGAVESVLKIHVVDVKVPLPFSAVFDKVAQNEDLVHASSKTFLLLSESLIPCFRDLPDDELS